jgi:hypothetical protein
MRWAAMCDIDLLNELDCADSCEAVEAFCMLVDQLLKDIQHLELECISTRYLLSQRMSVEQGEMLRMDILENLGRRFNNDPAYVLYRNLMYDGGDPMQFREYLAKVREASKGNLPCWH